MELRRPLRVASAVTFAVALSTACATGRFGPTPPGVVKSAPRSLKSVTVKERRAILNRAQVWTPIATETSIWQQDRRATAHERTPPSPAGSCIRQRRLQGCRRSSIAPRRRRGQDHTARRTARSMHVMAASRLLWALGSCDRLVVSGPRSVSTARRIRGASVSWNGHKGCRVSWRRARSTPRCSNAPSMVRASRPLGSRVGAWPELDEVDAAGEAHRAPR